MLSIFRTQHRIHLSNKCLSVPTNVNKIFLNGIKFSSVTELLKERQLICDSPERERASGGDRSIHTYKYNTSRCSSSLPTVKERAHTTLLPSLLLICGCPDVNTNPQRLKSSSSLTYSPAFCISNTSVGIIILPRNIIKNDIIGHKKGFKLNTTNSKEKKITKIR